MARFTGNLGLWSNLVNRNQNHYHRMDGDPTAEMAATTRWNRGRSGEWVKAAIERVSKLNPEFSLLGQKATRQSR
jgi:hypothetical protein